MLIELITPLVLATAPTAVVASEPVLYNHNTQMVALNSSKDILSYTGSGTRTYDYKGNPNDSDND
ncbi:hypothetical protein G6729_06715 [Polynucleobacter paneuropaeus]|nr:hypothetical protein G6729_06715 [Polynucleobacter paneuropaeus]